MAVTIDEEWSIPVERIQNFFESQKDVSADNQGFRSGQCRITLTPLTGRTIGSWPIPRTGVRMEGPEEDVRAIYRRFFLRFLSAGG